MANRIAKKAQLTDGQATVASRASDSCRASARAAPSSQMTNGDASGSILLTSKYGTGTGIQDAVQSSICQSNGICQSSMAQQNTKVPDVNPGSLGRGAGGAIPGTVARHRVPKNGSSLSQAIRSAERKGIERISRESGGAADRPDDVHRERCLLFIKSIEENAKAK